MFLGMLKERIMIASKQLKPPKPQFLRLHLFLAFFIFIMIGANDGAVGVLLPNLQSYYHVDKASISFLFLCGTAGYFVASFNNGLLIDRLGKQYALMVGAFIFSCGAGALILMPPFLVALLAFAFIGLGNALLDAGLNSYVAELPNNTTRLNYLHFFYGAGAWLGPVVASAVLALQWGWHSVYIVWLCFSLTALLALGIFFKERTSKALARAAIWTGSGKLTSNKKENLLSMTLKRYVVWLAAGFLLIYVGSEVTVGSWSYSFLTESRHMASLPSGWIVSGYWLGLSFGRLLLGHVAVRIGNKRMIQLCLVSVIVGLLLVWLVPIPFVTAFGLFLTGFSLGPIFPTTIALMPTLVSSRIVPTAIGFLASLGSMGAALFPWLAGNLAQYVGLWSLLPYVIVLAVVMFCIWVVLAQQPAEEISEAKE
jgi:fucose permease